MRALQVNFIGPVPAGPAQVQVRTLRQGKSVTQAQAIVTANDQIACLVSAVLGAPRPNSLVTHAPAYTSSRQAESLADLPFIAGKTPVFFQHFRSRWAEGDPPSTGGSTLHSKIWLQLQSASVPRELLTILFADAMPSPVMGTTRARVFGASLAWTIEFLDAAQHGDDSGWWRADTELIAHSQGYANQLTTIWTPEREAAARSQQVMAIYA
jgi:acyl-CoA thioesterase